MSSPSSSDSTTLKVSKENHAIRNIIILPNWCGIVNIGGTVIKVKIALIRSKCALDEIKKKAKRKKIIIAFVLKASPLRV